MKLYFCRVAINKNVLAARREKGCSAIRSELKKAGTPIPSNDVWIAALADNTRFFEPRPAFPDLGPEIVRLTAIS